MGSKAWVQQNRQCRDHQASWREHAGSFKDWTGAPYSRLKAVSAHLSVCRAPCLQILAQEQLLGRYGLLLSKMVHLRAFVTYPQELQSCALLALTQLMAVDGGYCSDNVAVLFTLLHKR